MTREAEGRLERRVLKSVLSKSCVYSLFALALLCALLFIAGFLWSLRVNGSLVVPENILLLLVGGIGFSLSCPWFFAAFLGRHLLMSIETLEHRAGMIADS